MIKQNISPYLISFFAFLLLFPIGGITQSSKSFLSPPTIITSSELLKDYSSDSRKFSGIPSIACTGKGMLWSVWYAGPSAGEDQNNYVVVAKSTDEGKSWSEVMVIDPDKDGPVRAFDPEIWLAPNGHLWIFWAQAIGHDGSKAGVWNIQSTNPNAENTTWSAPQRITDGIMMCKPTVLTTGEWVLPASTWRKTDYSARAIISNDKGKTWNLKGACNIPKEVRTYDEHMIVEKKDGTLWMLVRTNYGIGESTSTDRGKTWSNLEPSNLKHPSARFFIRRLHSGNLLLVKHGPISKKTSRSHLMAFLSKDEGKTWSKGLLIDQRPGVSYPDGHQVKDGTIYLTYDFDRTGKQHILMTFFNEEDIVSPNYDERILNIFKNKQVISDGGNN